jgi:hypothetical protein
MLTPSLTLARDRLIAITGTYPDEWRLSTDPLTGIGEEFFFMYKTNPDRFVYICVEDGIVTTTETN